VDTVTGPLKPPLLRVRNWDALYENSRSREIDHLKWFPVPNDLSADRYVELVAHEDGPAHLGVWIALLMVASRARPRGTLVRAGGLPHTTESLALVTRLPETVIKVAIERLLEIGLLGIGGDKPRKKSRLGSHPGAAKSQAGAARSREIAIEEKRIEHHHQEEKGTEKKRTELEGTEGAGEDSITEQSSARESSNPSPKNGDDDFETPAIVYASAEDELKAIFQTKTGELITLQVLGSIQANLELSNVTMTEFVIEVRKHVQNEWHNPAGFLLALSKRFRAKTRTAAEPVTATEAAVRDYKCSICHSTVPGEGTVLRDRVWVPCKCASPEWIARQQARGVFLQEPT
jgi:hypothetical protein